MGKDQNKDNGKDKGKDKEKTKTRTRTKLGQVPGEWQGQRRGQEQVLSLGRDNFVNNVIFSDIILSITFFLDGHPQFCAATLVLMLVPNAIVQIFSARWNQLDEYSSKPITCIHGMLLGTLHR